MKKLPSTDALFGASIQPALVPLGPFSGSTMGIDHGGPFLPFGPFPFTPLPILLVFGGNGGGGGGGGGGACLDGDGVKCINLFVGRGDNG